MFSKQSVLNCGVIAALIFSTSLALANTKPQPPADPQTQLNTLKVQVTQLQKENQGLRNQLTQTKTEINTLKSKQTQFESRIQVLENYVRTRARAPYIQ
jgi:peptidoglycan hydrolase CwlO-like protein